MSAFRIGMGMILAIGLLVGQVVSASAKEKPKSEEPPKTEGKPFETVIKDFSKIEGIFTFYIKKDEGKVLMEIKPAQFDSLYLCCMTRSTGDGTYYDNGADLGDFPFKFKRVGQNVQMLSVNTRFRADSAAALSKAIERGVSHSIFGVGKIESQPRKEDGAVLVNPAGFFIQDLTNLGYFLGKQRQLEYSFDKDNSYFGTIKSFPLNSEIDVVCHFKTNKPNDAQSFPSPYSMMHTYHFSLSGLPVTDYVPRLADERVGYFQTVYQDYSDLSRETPYVRYINRWNLKKAFPDSAISPPVEPIVFWLENTIPIEYRPYVEEGVLLWNKAFEKIGFRDAIVVKQMPDTASWDPADIRYNTIRWVIYPGQAYAVGPSRANPFTGQIYDADIRVCADFIRFMYSFSEYVVEPLKGKTGNEFEDQLTPFADRRCDYSRESAQNAAVAYTLLLTRDDFAQKPELTKRFVREYITDLVMHEVGHTLGLRHNFKASSIRSNADRLDTILVNSQGITGSVMDYNPVNLAPLGKPQSAFYHLGPGTYDYWAIEYGYRQFGADSPESEKDSLDKIASRSGDPLLAYGTDEDNFGNSMRAIDPLCTQFDLTSDPIAYFTDQIALSKELWKNIETKFESPGARYQKLLAAFQRGFRYYFQAAEMMPRYVGGIYRHNNHVGDEGSAPPFRPVDGATQKRAMAFLRDHIFAPDAFVFPPSLLNKLQPERLEDFGWSAGRANRIDYPVHDMVFSIQKEPIDRLLNPIALARMQDGELRRAAGEPGYSMADMFGDLRRMLWTELSSASNVNSYRRAIQRYHVDKLIGMILEKQPGLPEDARALARRDLAWVQRGITTALAAATLNTFTRSHYEESKARIEAALKAGLERNPKL